MKNCLISLFVILLNSFNIFAHDNVIHSEMTRTAYRFLEYATRNRFTNMYNHLDNGLVINPWQNGTIVQGAYREDEEDLVYGYSSIFIRDYYEKTSTHFWNADFGDNSETNFQGTWSGIYFKVGPYPNAYQKILKYRFGGWELKYDYGFRTSCPDGRYGFAPGDPILGIIFRYDNLIDYYKTGKAYACGAIDEDGNVIHVTPSLIYHDQEFRERISWEILGRMCHLLQDMTVPAHSRCDMHGSDSEGIRQDSYETHVYVSLYGPEKIFDLNTSFINPYDCPQNPLHYLMYINNQISDHFGSDGPYNGDGDNDKLGNILPEESQYFSTTF